MVTVQQVLGQFLHNVFEAAFVLCGCARLQDNAVPAIVRLRRIVSFHPFGGECVGFQGVLTFQFPGRPAELVRQDSRLCGKPGRAAAGSGKVKSESFQHKRGHLCGARLVQGGFLDHSRQFHGNAGRLRGHSDQTIAFAKTKKAQNRAVRALNLNPVFASEQMGVHFQVIPK